MADSPAFSLPFQLNLHPAVAAEVPRTAPTSPAELQARAEAKAAVRARFKLDTTAHPKAQRIAVLCGVSALLCYAADAGSRVVLAKATQDLAPIIDDSVQLASTILNLKTFETRRDSVASRAARVRQMDVGRYVYPRFVGEVIRGMPPGTWLTRIAPYAIPGDSAGTPALLVDGMTIVQEELPMFMTRLNESPWMESVTLGEASEEDLGGTKVTRFSLTVTARRDTTTATPPRAQKDTRRLPATPIAR